jgi:hypothetical protein
MRALVIAIVSFATFDIPGCVECKSPLCLTDDPDLLFDEKLVGEFEPVDRHPNQTRGFFRVERKAPESRVYRLTLHTFPSTKKADDAAESVKEPGDPLEFGILKLGDHRILTPFGPTSK